MIIDVYQIYHRGAVLIFIGTAGLVVWYLASGAQGPRINSRLGHSG